MVGTASRLNSASRLSRGKLRVGDPAGPAPSGAVVDFGGEDLGEIAEVGAAFAHRDVGEAGGLGADGGQVQLAGGRADGRLRGGIDGALAAAAAVGGAAVVRGGRGGGHEPLPVSRSS